LVLLDTSLLFEEALERKRESIQGLRGGTPVSLSKHKQRTSIQLRTLKATRIRFALFIKTKRTPKRQPENLQTVKTLNQQSFWNT
jgi:hypothetical protein